jgi:hypothetical protein
MRLADEIGGLTPAATFRGHFVTDFFRKASGTA